VVVDCAWFARAAAAVEKLAMMVRAELRGDAEASACGLTVRNSSPVLALCRKLIEAGHDPAERLEAYRGDVLCLTVRSIGEAAGLEVSGVGFIRHPERRIAPPVRPARLPATQHQNAGAAA
jgi:hypothetical protein